MVFPPQTYRGRPSLPRFFSAWNRNVLNRNGVSMHTRHADWIDASTSVGGFVPYLKALTLVSSLLVVWVGLCAI